MKKPVVGLTLLVCILGVFLVYMLLNNLYEHEVNMKASANELLVNNHSLERSLIELQYERENTTNEEVEDDDSDEVVLEEIEEEVDETISDEELTEELITKMNRYREDRGLTQFNTLEDLHEAATLKSADMKDNHYFDMESPNLGNASDIIGSYDIPYFSIAASLSAGVQDPVRVFEQLKDGNFSNYLYDPEFTHVGVGYESGGSYGHYWTVYFIDHPIEQDVDEMEELVFKIVNEIREENGLDQFLRHDDLAEVARMKSEDMRDYNYVAHESPNYGAPYEMVEHFEIDNRGSAENIAAGQKTPEEVVGGWMNSDGHRANILNEDLTHLGVGFAQGGEQNSYWTQLFIIE
ncbi:CAP domain-containing protein [Alkalibacillus silvisoli]|uniref:SCP domain-containing protein n=1 Tax=Alkalibacillus silvisoli TaxID=392823 RepID=A0ABP3JS94_9BACI